jgi:hypothetical protein
VKKCFWKNYRNQNKQKKMMGLFVIISLLGGYSSLLPSVGCQIGGLSGGNGLLPAMMSAAFSAIMITGAFKFPLTIEGITLASTTFRFSKPHTFIVSGSTTAIGSLDGPILHVQDGW